MELVSRRRAVSVDKALHRSVDTMKLDIASTPNLEAAWAYYLAIRPIAIELNALVDVAASRVEHFLGVK